MRYRTRLFLIVLVVLLSGCTLNLNGGSRNIVTENREISDVQNVSFNGTGELIVTQGETEALTIETSDTIMPSITTEVQDGELIIGFRDTVLSTDSIKFDLTTLYHSTIWCAETRVSR